MIPPLYYRTLPTEICLLNKLGESLIDTSRLDTYSCKLLLTHFFETPEALLIGDNRFTGPLPTELGCLTKLGDLRMENNDFSGTLVSEIGSLSRLIWLHLENNRLEGTIPESIWNLNNLEELHLREYYISLCAEWISNCVSILLL